MKQERRKLSGDDRGLDTREPAQSPPWIEDGGASTPEPLRSFDGAASVNDESLRGKSDGEILQRYEF